ncbi:MAG: putative 4-hydroxybenzoate polyprenyltransferase [Fimbriimonadaceae bacterium]|nr:putative 4-hydroxybenzoate polyprenyltransferase [Fimbriimonadaceae bacterium]
MAQAAKGFQALRIYLEMIKFEHSIFALPFAMIGMMWGSLSAGGNGWPGWWIFTLIVVAMVSSRSAAMAYNRIADRDIDAENPRTKIRAIPAGLLSLRQANLFFFGSCIVFFAAAALLNSLTLILSPVALFIVLLYSRTKRFTWLCHFVLGLSLGIAPAAAWIGVTGSLSPTILPLVGAVLLWTAGFDLIYALQDDEFDRAHGLRSLPARFGRRSALWVSRFCHAGAVGLLAWSVLMAGGGLWSWLGVGFAACLLAYEQSLVRPDDLSRVNLAFFTLNGFVSLGVFGFVLIDVLTGSLV